MFFLAYSFFRTEENIFPGTLIESIPFFSFQPLRLGAIGYLVENACRPTPNGSQYARDLSNGAWWYFISKVVELLDTVFFVLRKKQAQVTFLHVYHHSVTCLFSWGYLKYLPGKYLFLRKVTFFPNKTTFFVQFFLL